MNVEGHKIRTLIEIYGKSKNYLPKEYLSGFCKDNDVNYSQWNAYIGERQVVGIKIIDLLMHIFPNLNMNWLLKDDPNPFIGVINAIGVNEPVSNYNKTVKKITNEDLMKKLVELEDEIIKLKN
jgi:hypothetical protein